MGAARKNNHRRKSAPVRRKHDPHRIVYKHGIAPSFTKADSITTNFSGRGLVANPNADIEAVHRVGRLMGRDGGVDSLPEPDLSGMRDLAEKLLALPPKPARKAGADVAALVAALVAAHGTDYVGMAGSRLNVNQDTPAQLRRLCEKAQRGDL